MRGSDVRRFINNSGAQQAMVAGYSKNGDSAAIAAVQHLLAASLQCRIFYEWVDSKANVIDALSRDANGAWKGWDVEGVKFPSLASLQDIPLQKLFELFVAA